MGIKESRRVKVKPLFKVILRNGMTKNLKARIGFRSFVLLMATSQLYKSAIH
jgi:hypothetical protein